MVKRFHGSRRFIFTGSWSATHVLLSFVFFTKNRQFAAIDCDVFMCGSYRIAGSELPRGLGAYVSPYLYSALSRARSFKTITVLTNDQQINADGSVQYRTRNIVYSEVLYIEHKVDMYILQPGPRVLY